MRHVKKVRIPSTVTLIKTCAFRGCEYLEEVIFQGPPAIKRIGKYAFTGCAALVHFKLPLSVEILGAGAFPGSGLQSFAFEPGFHIKQVAENVFASCYHLKAVTLPASVEFVDSSYFVLTTAKSSRDSGKLFRWMFQLD
jgi:hypothetical protein